MADIQNVNPACPYWSPDCDQLCKMSVDGLHLPLPEHIANFCQTPQWEQCPHYVRGAERLLELTWKRGLMQERGRRRHHRFSVRRAVILGEDPDLPDDSSKVLNDHFAWTIDLSIGGMRIETNAAMPERARISFAFCDDLVLSGLGGLAEVRWQRQINKTGTHQCGLAFLDQRSSWVVGETLGKYQEVRDGV